MKLSESINICLKAPWGKYRETLTLWRNIAGLQERTIAELIEALRYYLEPAPTDPDELAERVNESSYTPALAERLIERAEALIK